MQAATDRIRLVRDGPSGIEAIAARFAGHAYDLHRHDEWLVGVTDAGVQDFFCRGARRLSTPARAILIEPQEAHDGQAGSPGGFAYRMLYLPRAWLLSALALVGDAALGFRQTLQDDGALATAIGAACDALSGDAPRLGREAALDRVVQRLRPHLGAAPQPAPSSRDSLVARRARECLLDAMAEDIGADALAAASGAADRFQMARAFRLAYGAAPHAWLIQARLMRARRLLAQGGAPADVAATCGFADQSHLGRWFRRAYGMTPGGYRACCTGVPDSAGRSG